MDRLFEMHSREMGWADGSHENFENYPEKFVTQDNYPLEAVERFLGKVGFTCSIGYMLGLALLRGYRKIGLWGVHAANDTEYAYQRDNLIWLLGFAAAKGCDVSLPGDSLLRLPRRYYGVDFPVYVDGQWDYDVAKQLQRSSDGANGVVRA